MFCRRLSRDDEDAAADHGADAERGQSPRPERALELRSVFVREFGEIGFLGEQAFEHGDPKTESRRKGAGCGGKSTSWPERPRCQAAVVPLARWLLRYP